MWTLSISSCLDFYVNNLGDTINCNSSCVVEEGGRKEKPRWNIIGFFSLDFIAFVPIIICKRGWFRHHISCAVNGRRRPSYNRQSRIAQFFDFTCLYVGRMVYSSVWTRCCWNTYSRRNTLIRKLVCTNAA